MKANKDIHCWHCGIEPRFNYFCSIECGQQSYNEQQERIKEFDIYYKAKHGTEYLDDMEKRHPGYKKSLKAGPLIPLSGPVLDQLGE